MATTSKNPASRSTQQLVRLHRGRGAAGHRASPPTQFWTGLAGARRALRAAQPRAARLPRRAAGSRSTRWHREHGAGRQRSRGLRGASSARSATSSPSRPTSRSRPTGLDPEITGICGPQLVVPVNNARYALNAANARWGSLYDALYGTDVIPRDGRPRAGQGLQRRARRGRGRPRRRFPRCRPSRWPRAAIAMSRRTRSPTTPASRASSSTPRPVRRRSRIATQFVGYREEAAEADVLLRHNGLHVILVIDRDAPGRQGAPRGSRRCRRRSRAHHDPGLRGLRRRGRCRGQGRCVYRNWLGLMNGTLEDTFEKGGQTVHRKLNADRVFKRPEARREADRSRAGRCCSCRNVGHLMTTPAVLDADGNEIGEGLGEVKRMFTLPEVRGQRIGAQLLQRIEALARDKGITRLVLETGEAPGFEPAYRVYERGGFTRLRRGARLSRFRLFAVLRKEARLMTDLTKLTIAEARTKLRAQGDHRGRADRRLSRRRSTRANPHLNAYVAVTPRQGARHGEGVRRAAGQGRGRGAGRHPARHQGSVRHRRRPHPGLQPRPRRLQAALRIDRHGQSLGRRRGHAGQAQHGRVRHGLVQRDLLLRPGGQPVAALARSTTWSCRRRIWATAASSRAGGAQDRAHAGQSAAGAGRLVGRLGRGGLGLPLRRRDRDRHRRLDPPAGRLHRHGRHQADLWPLLALGHRRLRLVARPGRADRPRRARRRDHAEVDGLGRSEGHDLRRPSGAGLRGGASASRSRA